MQTKEAALLAASREGNLTQVKQLLDEFVADKKTIKEYKKYINTADEKGETALFHAYFNSHWEVVKELLRRGAHVNHKNNEGQTILHKIAQGKTRCEEELFEELIARGLKLDVQDNQLKTPLHLATFGNLEVLTQLLMNGASPYRRDKDNKTPLQTVIASKAPFIINHFLSALICNIINSGDPGPHLTQLYQAILPSPQAIEWQTYIGKSYSARVKNSELPNGTKIQQLTIARNHVLFSFRQPQLGALETARAWTSMRFLPPTEAQQALQEAIQELTPQKTKKLALT